MSENTETNTEVAAPEGTENTQTDNQVSEIESRARAMGWVDQDEYQGNGKWRTAEDFVDRSELFGKIEQQRKQIQNLHKTQQAFSQHLETSRRAGFETAMKQLREERRAALQEGDPDAILATEDKMRILEREVIQAQQQANIEQATPEVPQEFTEWSNRNTWYNPSNEAMVAYADSLGKKFAHRVQAGELTPGQVLQEVEAAVRKEFPQKFTNPNRSKPSAVESGSTRPSRREDFPLTDGERRTMDKLVRSGALTKEQYIADLKAIDPNRRA
jgi:hypothetical protein